jgi:hypothetical protein
MTGASVDLMHPRAQKSHFSANVLYQGTIEVEADDSPGVVFQMLVEGVPPISVVGYAIEKAIKNATKLAMVIVEHPGRRPNQESGLQRGSLAEWHWFRLGV